MLGLVWQEDELAQSQVSHTEGEASLCPQNWKARRHGTHEGAGMNLCASRCPAAAQVQIGTSPCQVKAVAMLW